MINKVRSLKGGTGFLIGLVVAIVLVPSTTVAALALTYTGIEGVSGRTADVSTAHQLFTGPANPVNYFNNADAAVTGTYSSVATPPTGDALVVTSVHISFYSVPSPGSADYINFSLANAACTGFVGPYQHAVYPGSMGETDLTFNPGIVIHSGDALCAIASNVSAYADVSGYVGPAAQF